MFAEHSVFGQSTLRSPLVIILLLHIFCQLRSGQVFNNSLQNRTLNIKGKTALLDDIKVIFLDIMLSV